MSSGSEQHSKYTVYSFSDNKEKFQEWKIKTLSLARVHKVHRYLTKEIEIPDEAAAELQGEGSKEQKTYDGNVKAYDILVRSCTLFVAALITIKIKGSLLLQCYNL